MNKKLLLTLTLTLILSVFMLKAQTTKKVLFLGNSYTYYSDMPDIVEQLALSNGDTLIHDRNTPGGHKLIEHAVSALSINKIQSEDWDHVVLQDHSLRPAYHYLEFYKGAEQLIQLINEDAPCLNKTIFYMTWGRENNGSYPYNEHQQLTTDGYNTMANILDTEVSPVGAAWKKVRDDNDFVDLYDPDGSHPSYAGSYLAACVFYATIFDKSPVGLTFTGSLTSANAAYLQEKAFEAYNEYVTLNLIHTGTLEDTVADVFRAKLNNSASELNSLIANNTLNTTFDFAYIGYSSQSNINTNLKYIIYQNGNQVINSLAPISMTVEINECVNQTSTYPLNIDLFDVAAGIFNVDILLNGNLIADYTLQKEAVINNTIEIVNEDLFSFYPNPAKAQIQIQSEEQIEELTIQDIIGKDLTIQSMPALHETIDVSNLKSGLYILQARIGNKVSVRKLTIL
ncbi:MAG: hypothetical protein ACI9XO_004059 [Paraglaciecola sp.]|jgi:hypothetical protein